MALPTALKFVLFIDVQTVGFVQAQGEEENRFVLAVT
jgi:hypothetical protein